MQGYSTNRCDARLTLMARRKNPGAVALGRRGGKAAAGKGARQAWAKFSPEERSEIMRERAKVRAKNRK